MSKEYWEKSATNIRPYEAYEKVLNLDSAKLQGKTILDLGSGASEEFKSGIRERKIDAEVISLNPSLGPDTQSGKDARLMSTKERAVAGIAEKLPFKERTFDLVISVYAIPLWFPHGNTEINTQAFSEITRVLKDGGEARIFPAGVEDPGDIDPTFYSAVVELEQKGYQIKWERITDAGDDEESVYGTSDGWLLIVRRPTRNKK